VYVCVYMYTHTRARARAHTHTHTQTQQDAENGCFELIISGGRERMQASGLNPKP
jgi:hypothetical protein